MIEIRGIVFDNIFRNEDNGYTVALIETDENVVTITGSFPQNLINETIIAYGEVIKHPKYGEQFKVETYSIILPTNLEQIENYLSSGLIKGIGQSLAKRIVDKFQEDTFSIIQKQPQRLMEIEGIGEVKADIIKESFIEHIDVKEIMMFLQSHNISPNYSIKIYKQYGKETIRIISENPYKLAEDIYGIGFKLADKIATSLGVDKKSIYRIHSGVKFVLFEASLKGHTFLPKDRLLMMTSKLLETTTEEIEFQLKEMALHDKIRIENFNNTQCIYYVSYHIAEVNTCNKLIELLSCNFDNNDEEINRIIDNVQNNNEFKLSETQYSAVRETLKNGVTVITGGPGTGKTTIIKTIIDIFEVLNQKVMLCAPTGRASKRMTESTGKEAKTIHRILEYAYGEIDSNLSFNKNEDSPLKTDVIIVDEVSMIDILLMNNLLKALTKGTRLILVGDIDQLPSVGAGNVLKDIIESDTIPTITLDKIFRQSEDSFIIKNAHIINNGKMPIYNQKNSDFYFMTKQNDKDITRLIVDLYSNRLPKSYKIDPIKSIQILSPMKKGDAGVLELNNSIQAVINPPHKFKTEKKVGNNIFRVGDKVMQIKNNYQLPWIIKSDNSKDLDGEGVYNGDIGYIIFIDETNQEVIIQYDENKEAKYNFSQLDEIMLAYAITVHKSQGSEFPIVILPMTWAPQVLLSRNLLYTAITRAKNLVVLVGKQKYIEKMIKNDKIDYRYSSLNIRLKRINEFYGW